MSELSVHSNDVSIRNQDLSKYERDLLFYCVHRHLSDVDSLVEIVKKQDLEDRLRIGALSRLWHLNEQEQRKYRDKILAVIEELLSYDNDGSPIHISDDVRIEAYKLAMDQIISEDEYEHWCKKVVQDPSTTIQWYSKQQHRYKKQQN